MNKPSHPSNKIPLKCMDCGTTNPEIIHDEENGTSLQWALADRNGSILWPMMTAEGEVEHTFRLISGTGHETDKFLTIGGEGGIVHAGDKPLCIECFEKRLESGFLKENEDAQE